MRSILHARCVKPTPSRPITTSLSLPAQVQHVQLPKIIRPPGSAHHNSLPSFLEYADRVNLAPSKTVYVGTHYEYTSAIALLRLGFSLLRTGRKSDAGIDLIGHWILPQLPEPLPVIVQCKVRTPETSCAPKHIRELEGAFQGVPADWRKKDVLGLLVSSQKATRGVLEALGGNRWPMGFLKISRKGTIEQFLWNKAASERGLEGVGVTLRHTPRILLPTLDIEEQGEEGSGWNVRKRRNNTVGKFKDAGTKKDIQLTWMGSPIFPDREGLDEETVQLMNQIAVDDEVELVPKTRKRLVTAKSVSKRNAVKTSAPKSKSAAQKGAGKKSAAKPASGKKSARKTAVNKEPPILVKRGRGRPPGSKNKATLLAEALPKRGRSKGSKAKAGAVLENKT